MRIISWLSEFMIPFVISYMIAFGLFAHRPVFDDFLSGAKEGMKIVAGILPTLIGLMTAVGVLRASGFLDAAERVLGIFAAVLHFPKELIPLTLVRLISNSAATGLALDLFKQFGPDSPLGMAASVILGSTETVFYCISLYFGSVRVKKTRYTVPGALLATAVGIAVSIWLSGIS